MKTRIISTLVLLAGMMFSGCSREEVPDGGVAGEGNRVVFTLAGITSQNQTKTTRATGDNNQTSTLSATEEEKHVSSLLAVAYERQSSGDMGLYKVFDVTVSDEGCSFDIAKEGSFELYLVANANTELTSAIKALEATSPVSELEEQIVSQASGSANAFVMTTPSAIKVISYSGEVADCGEVSLRRLSVRIDLVNKADELTVNRVTFRNRAVKSQLFTPNQMISGDDIVQDTVYEDVNLVGSFDVPTEYKAHIYSYENLSARGDATIPTLEIEYTYQDQPYTHQIQFLDANDPSGLTPLALKRNYLYRITIGRKLEPEFNVEVLDWTNEDSFGVDEIPFQNQMNASLAVSRFASANVASMDEAQHSVTFTTTNPNTTSLYTAWNAQWAQSVYYNESDKTYYRVPTKDEMYLLFPDNANVIRFDQAMDGTSEVTETLPTNLFGSTEVNGGEGQSRFKNVAANTLTTRATGVDYPIVYAIRFKGTAQYAAYRYEIKKWDDPSNGELEIRIKALQEGSLWTLDEISNEAYWGNPSEGNTDADNQLIYHIPATGWKESSGEEVQGQGTNSYLWTSEKGTEDDQVYIGGHQLEYAHVVSHRMQSEGTLRLVKATDAEIQTALNAALKVNMFTDFNAKEFNLVGKTITSFYETLAVSLDECPASTYVTWSQLKKEGACKADAIFTGPSGHGKYRLPTMGEVGLLIPRLIKQTINKPEDAYCSPYWNDNSSTNTYPYVMVTTPFEETFYLKNDSNGCPDESHGEDTDSEYTLKGECQLKRGDNRTEILHYYTHEPDDAEKGNYNMYPVYGLRFKGTSQYAAYRWESKKIASEPTERYLSIKIKAIREDNQFITINDVANEAFWEDGSFIEFKIPATGYYQAGIDPSVTPQNRREGGIAGYLLSSTAEPNSSKFYRLGFIAPCADLVTMDNGASLQLRFVRVQE